MRPSFHLSDIVRETKYLKLITYDIFAVKINDNKLCARDLNNRIDACQGNSEGEDRVKYDFEKSLGDSGGPLVLQKKADDRRCKRIYDKFDNYLHVLCFRPLLLGRSCFIWVPLCSEGFPRGVHQGF